ncbi:MAG TPA: bifunctional DNA-formamidopyrimidine glycosylase/DNA-(apurinic or apyrimidinic site) lyase [Burkholderiaceae bacterium]|nr:bifunctional DNA-formamidopyrimidine glycosylase/DNA-(apurinic or apyrimidinic site) lyase [Burkholderiaceae bacterium]
MPELPEVEVTRIGLADRLRGARVRSVHVGSPLRWPLGVTARSLRDLEIGELSRRGKYLWMPLSGRARSGGLLWHLGMSGSLMLHVRAPPPRGRHDHFELVSSAGTLRLTDPRRFGAVLWSDAIDSDPARRLLAGLGAEPFDPQLNARSLHEACKRRRCSIKAALLAGDIVVGAGNIYACEALFRAGIDPRMRCQRLSLPRCERLLQALRDVLSEAVALGGSTLRNFRDANGGAGEFQINARVYGRVGMPCLQCRTPVRRVVQAQRSTFFCPHCQSR